MCCRMAGRTPTRRTGRSGCRTIRATSRTRPRSCSTSWGGDRPFRLLTNNPKKADDLRAHGLARITVDKHVIGVGEHNRRYLAAKRDWGHSIEDGDLAAGELDEPPPR